MENNELQYGVVRMTVAYEISETRKRVLQRQVARFAPELAQMEWESSVEASSSLMSLSVRRVNLVNMGAVACAVLQFADADLLTAREIRAWHRAAVDVLDNRRGDVVIEATDDFPVIAECSEPAFLPEPKPKLKPKPERTERKSVSKKSARRSIIESLSNESRSVAGSMMSFNVITEDLDFAAEESATPEARVVTADEQEEQQIAALDLEQQRAIKEIQAAIIRYVTTYHADPHELLLQLQGKIVVDDKPSPLVVNRDM